MILDRAATFIQKRIRARKIGVTLWKSESFELPSHVLINGKQVPVRFPDERGVRVAFSELFFGDCYGLEKAKPPIKTVLDIGANVGIFALAARNAFPDAVIHSYEPNPQLEGYLKTQAEAANSRYFMEAVEVEDCHVNLDIRSDSVQTTSAVDENSPIPAVAFRKALDRLGGSADFAKVDCEGAEWCIWQDRDAWQKVKFLSTEYHLQDGHTHEEAHSMITSLGFRVTYQERAETFGVIRALRS